jgi:hypothetical protein
MNRGDWQLAPGVNVFNGGPTDLSVSVNRGAAFTVKGVDPPGWAPQQPQSGGPGFDNGGPSPNNFGPGNNTVTFQVGTALAYNDTVVLNNVPVVSLQFYLLLRDAETVEWFICSAGTVVDSSYGKPETKASATAPRRA